MKNFLALQIDQTNLRVCNHEQTLRVEENFRFFRAWKPCDFLIFVKQVFEHVDFLIFAADFNHNLLHDIYADIAVLCFPSTFIDLVTTDDVVNVVLGTVLVDAEIFDCPLEVFARFLVFKAYSVLDLKLWFR